MRANPKTHMVEVIVPPRTLDFSVRRFINKHIDWIEERQKAFPQKTDITNDAIIPYCGQDYRLSIVKHDKRTTSITLGDSKIIIKTAREDPSQNLKRWMKERCLEMSEPLAHEKALSIGQKIKKFDLRDTSSRWGSCSTDKRVMISWRLIMAPDYVLDYVIAHEVAHLKHMDHSQKFWDLCYSLSDDAPRARQWLNDHGNRLLAIF